jgi:hypothetical protein
VVDTLPEQRLAADLVQIPLSLLFLELGGYYLNAVQLDVHAADVLVRRAVYTRRVSDNRLIASVPSHLLVRMLGAAFPITKPPHTAGLRLQKGK